MSFYPEIGAGTPGQGIHYGGGQQSHPPPPPPPPPEGHHRHIIANGGGHGAQNMTLSVRIADAYQIQPPVPVKKNLGQVERTQTAFDFDLERRLLLEQSTGESTFAPMDPATVHDPYDEAMEPYLQMGLLRDEVAVALAVYDGNTEQEQVLEFCKSYRDLLSMGFPPELVAGALMRNRDDLTAATEACLSAQSTQ